MPVTPPAVPAPSAADPTRVDEIAAAVERRLSAWVDGRVRAAERRLELQAEAFEVALGEEAAGSRRAAEQVEASRAESREGIERGLGGVDSRLRELFEEFRSEQEAVGAAQEADIRRRTEIRVDELAAGLSQRLDRELGRKLSAAQVELERANAETLERARTEARAGVEATINREVAKGEARLAAASQRIDLIADEKVAAGIAAAEKRLNDALSSRRVEDQRALAQQVGSLGSELSAGLADRARESAAEAAARARREALAGIAADVDAAVEAASRGARAEFDAVVGEAAQSAVSAEAERVKEELEQAASDAVGVHANAFREELSTVSYRDHSRRAEAAATAQLARSLDALKAQRNALAAELAEVGAAERQGVAAERTRIEAELAQSVTEVRVELDQRAAELRATAEAAVARRADEALSSEFERRAAELERRLEALAARSEEESSRRFSAAVSEAEARLVAVEHAQQREEQVRLRINAAEREAERRVREAERRLIDVLARIDTVQSR